MEDKQHGYATADRSAHGAFPNAFLWCRALHSDLLELFVKGLHLVRCECGLTVEQLPTPNREPEHEHPALAFGQTCFSTGF